MDIGTLSPDGHYQWDGEKWLPIQLLTTSEDGFWLWNGNEWIPNPLANTSPNLTPENTTESREIQTPQANTHSQQSVVSSQQVVYPHQYPHQQVMMVRSQQKSWWTTNKVIALVVLIPVVLILLVASLVVFSGFLFVWANSADIAETPEFGFRHDVEASLYEDLGANRGSFSSVVQYPDFSSTVYIYGEDSDGEFWSGSGVIISEYWVLTAAHVVEDLLVEKSWVFEGSDFEDPDGYMYEISEIILHPGWESDSELLENGMDIALISLEVGIDLSRSAIAAWDNMPNSERLEIGALLYTSGYGLYDEGYSECSSHCLVDENGSYSQRRAWSNILDRDIKNLNSDESYVNDDVWLGGFVVYDFDSPGGNHNSLAQGRSSTLQQGSYGYVGEGSSSATPLNLEGTSVAGDSGGPTFALLDGEWTVIGLTSHGSPTANYGDVAVNTRVSSHSLWICSVQTPNNPILGCE